MLRRRLLLAAPAPWLLPIGSARANSADLVIGMFAPMSGPLSSRLSAFTAGARLVFDGTNAAGGIQGRRLRFSVADDHGRVEESVAAARQLLQRERAGVLFGCVGSESARAVLPLLRRAGVPALASQELSDAVRMEGGRIVYPIRAGLGREAEAVAQHLSDAGLRSVAILHEPGPAGGALQRLLGDACATRQLQVIGSAAVTSDPGVPLEAARKLAGLAPQALLLAVPGRLALAVMQATQSNVRLPAAFGLSLLAEDGHVLRLGARAGSVTVAQVIPNPWSPNEAMLIEYRRQATAARVPISYPSVEGWLSAQVLVEALRRCGRDTSPARLHAVLDGLKMTIAGMEIDFSRRELAGSRYVELVQVTADGRWRS